MAEIGIDFSALISVLADKLYSTPAVFLRENVQNAIDAVRMLPIDGRESGPQTKVDVTVDNAMVQVEDYGIGMSESDLREFFWYVGRSSKQTKAAQACNVIGQFGIGAFANFGACTVLEVHSKRLRHPAVTSTIRKRDLDAGRTSYDITPSKRLTHDGTIIIATTSQQADSAKLRAYLEDHVKHVPELIRFDKISISQKSLPDQPAGASEIGRHEFIFGPAVVRAVVWKHQAKVGVSLSTSNKEVTGLLEIGAGSLAVYNNRFLVASNVSSIFPLRLPTSGFINTTFLRPNVTREGLDGTSAALVEQFLRALGPVVLDILDASGLLYEYADVTAYVGNLPYATSEKYLAKLPVRLYGKRRPLNTTLSPSERRVPAKAVEHRE